MLLTITIDPEFRSFIPKMKPEEFKKLEESLRSEGCREPLVIWKGHDIILDGHNRFHICRDLGIDYLTVEKEFKDRDHAKLWVLRNQLGRRNLSDLQFKLLVGQEYELENKLHGGDRRSETFKEKSRPQNEALEYERTRDRIAKEHGISKSTVERSADLYKAHKAIGEVAPEVAREIESESIKTTQTDIVAVGEALETATPEEKVKLVEEIKTDFKKAAKKVSSKKPKKPKKEPETVIRPISAMELWCNDCNWGFDVYPPHPKGLDASTICPYCGGPNIGRREENWTPTEDKNGIQD